MAHDGGPRPRSVAAAIINNGPLVVDVLAADLYSLTPNYPSVAVVPMALVRVTDVHALSVTQEAAGVLFNSSDTALGDVKCYKNVGVDIASVVGQTMHTPPRYNMAVTTISTRHVGSRLLGSGLRGGAPSADYAGGAGRPNGLILRPGEGLAVSNPGAWLTTGTTAPRNGIRVEFIARNLADDGLTAWTVTDCVTTGASASGPQPRVYAALWNPADSTEAIEVIMVYATCETDEYAGLPLRTSLFDAVMPWGAVEDGHPTLVDLTADAVDHSGVRDLSDWGVRCVVGDIPFRLARNDFARTEGGAYYSGDESAVSIISTSSGSTNPIPGAFWRQSLPYFSGASFSLPHIQGTVAQKTFRKQRRRHGAIAVHPGEAYVVTQLPQFMNVITASSGPFDQAAAIVDIEIALQVRAPRGVPFVEVG